MSDWLDEMLSDLPIDESSKDLVKRIQAHIAYHRRRKERIQNALRVLNAIAVLVAVLLLVPGFQQLMDFIPSFSSLQLEQAVRSVLESPTDASMQLWIAVQSWAGYLLSSMDGFLILAFILLSLNAWFLMSDSIQGKEHRKGVIV
jgi:hypothetical protein